MTKKNPKVSIIIPFYNRTAFLIETIESIRNQTFENFEVIIIDDGSIYTNFLNASKYIETSNDKRFSFFSKPSNYPRGANGSRNYGFHLSSGEYIKWFDSDDIMLPDFLQVQVQILESANLDGVLANCGVYNENFSKKLRDSWQRQVYSDNVLEDYLKTTLAWQTGSGLWNKAAIGSNFEPFQEQITNSQEWVFHLCVLTSNLKIGIIEKELFKIRVHENSISGNFKKSSSNVYIKNRLKARIIALLRLMETRNGYKKYLFRSMFNMLRKKPQLIFSSAVYFFRNVNSVKIRSGSRAEFFKIIPENVD